MTQMTPVLAMRDRIDRFDWANTPIGARDQWPSILESLVDMILRSAQPMFMAWGDDRTWFYNDAFIPILGRKHPVALGRPSSGVWTEAWSDLEPLFARVFRGESISMDDIKLMLDRGGQLEEAHFAFSYTPVKDPGADGFAGLFGVCVETTERYIAETRERGSQSRQRRLFEQAPGFVIIMRGPDHVIEFVNDAHRAVFGSTGWVGLPIRDAFPSVSGQGFFEKLD